MWCSNQLSYRTIYENHRQTSVWCSNQLSYRTIYENHRQTRKRKRSTKRHPARTAVYQLLSHPRTKGISRKEVFQPHLPVRLPCYDLAPITGFALGRPSRLRTSGAPGFHGLTGGVYKARERIHRAMADARFTSESSFTESGCRLRSELRGDFTIRSLSPGGGALCPPL